MLLLTTQRHLHNRRNNKYNSSQVKDQNCFTGISEKKIEINPMQVMRIKFVDTGADRSLPHDAVLADACPDFLFFLFYAESCC